MGYQIIRDEAEKTAEIHITDMDIALAEILHHEALQLPEVVFAGVVSPHPLIKEVVIKVKTSQGDPVRAIEKAASAASRKAKELSDAIGAALSKQQRGVEARASAKGVEAG